MVACGGFSYGDVLGAGEGWAKSILFHPAVREMSASIRAVVVFPFVPETHATPYSSSAASAPMKLGSSVSATSPGRAVAPRPVARRPSRVSFPAALAMSASASGTNEAYRRVMR